MGLLINLIQIINFFICDTFPDGCCLFFLFNSKQSKRKERRIDFYTKKLTFFNVFITISPPSLFIFSL